MPYMGMQSTGGIGIASKSGKTSQRADQQSGYPRTQGTLAQNKTIM